MKNISLLLLFPVIFCCSCQRRNGMPDLLGLIQISRPFVNSVEGTKSSIIQNSLPDLSTFGLFGYCIPFEQNGDRQPDWGAGSSSWENKKGFSHPDVFFNQEMTVQEGTICTYTPSQYWYSEDEENINGVDKFKYTFFGYYPYDTEETIQVISPKERESTELPVILYTMPFTSSDILTALDDSAIKDLMYATSINTYKKDGRVSLKFNHAQVGLRAKFKNYNKNKIVEITKAELRCQDFYRTASMNFTDVENLTKFMVFDESDRYSGTYQMLDTESVILDLAESEDRVEYTSSKTILLLTNLNAEKNTLGENAKLHLEMKTTDKTSGKVSLIRFDDYRLPDNFRAYPGIVYVLEVNMVDKNFVVNIIARNSEIWEDGGDSDMETN